MFQPVLTPSDEKELVDYVSEIERRLFGLMYKDLRGLTFEIAEANKFSHNFITKFKLAEEDLLASFMKSHLELLLQKFFNL